jgi:hypothetical protein
MSRKCHLFNFRIRQKFQILELQGMPEEKLKNWSILTDYFIGHRQFKCSFPRVFIG